jgi:predicted hydrolase (HD superfamily)
MRGYARKFGQDEDRWAIAGLLHDFNREICPTPEAHPTYGSQILQEHGYPEGIIRAVLTHGDHTGIPRQTLMEHALYAVDELSGFIRR